MAIKTAIISGITNPKLPANAKDAVKSFNFDYSYWSHDVSQKFFSNKKTILIT
jgi:kinesin family protein 1